MSEKAERAEKDDASDPLSEIEAISNPEEQIAMLLAIATDQAIAGEKVDISLFCEKFPQHADELRKLWSTFQIADLAGSSNSALDQGSHGSASRSGTLETIQLPMTFGDYELIEEVGRGGMGIVYRARQKSLDRIVAIKMILKGQFATEEERKRFQSEASAAAIEHPNIVPVYEVGEYDGQPFYCMKFIDGETLRERLQRGVFSSRDAASFVSKVAKAIHFAHLQGILHRDLKPSNILIDKNGEPHISDFGLAKQTSTQESMSMTKTGAVLGTPSYMAPEQAAGDRRGTVNALSDLYSVGSILYCMLTARPPFQSASPVDTVLMLLDQEPIPPHMLNRNIDRSLEMITLKCLQKPQDLRYDSAEMLAQDLDAYVNDEPVSARSGLISQFFSRVFRETHNAAVLEKWGLPWMFHGVALLVACFSTNAMMWFGVKDRMTYSLLWTVGLGLWASAFWFMRRRLGPVTFVERQIAHVWAGSLVCIGMLFPIEWWTGMDVLTLTPIISLISGMSFLIKAGILDGRFYFWAAAFFLTAIPMSIYPPVAHFIFGIVAASSFFFPGLKYYRLSKQS